MKNAVAREDALRYQLVGLIPHLRRFARGLAKDPDKADDLVQTACERALKRLKRPVKELRLENFLYRIIYNRWIDNLRRCKTRSAKLIILSEENAFKASDAQSDDRLDMVLDLQSALNQLDEEHRAAIMLICVEGYSYAEAATVLEVPSGTVASRVARARAKLGQILLNRSPKIIQVKKNEQIEGRK